MTSVFKKAVVTFGAFSLIGGATALFLVGNDALACGWNGGSGGESFQSQQKNSNLNQPSAISKEQAVELVSNYVEKLNAKLIVGNLNDVGPLYEAEILSADEKEVLQVIGVYKQSGKLVVIN